MNHDEPHPDQTGSPWIRLWWRTRVPHVDSRSVLASILSAEQPGTEVRIDRTDQGQPILLAPTGHISISHSGAHLLLGLSSRPLGVDCEYRTRERNWQALADRYFFPAESRSIRMDADPGSLFLRHWVAKEALLKCFGIGIAGHLGGIELAEVQTETPTLVRLPGTRVPSDFGVRLWQEGNRFVGIAVESNLNPGSWTISGLESLPAERP